jgi:hypothetical protein
LIVGVLRIVEIVAALAKTSALVTATVSWFADLESALHDFSGTFAPSFTEMRPEQG